MTRTQEQRDLAVAEHRDREHAAVRELVTHHAANATDRDGLLAALGIAPTERTPA